MDIKVKLKKTFVLKKKINIHHDIIPVCNGAFKRILVIDAIFDITVTK